MRGRVREAERERHCVWQRAVQQSRKHVVKWVSHCAVHERQPTNECGNRRPTIRRMRTVQAGFRYRGGLVWRLEVARRMLSCYPLSARRNLANSRPSRLHLPCRISELGMVQAGFRYRGGLVWRLEVARRMLSCYPLSARRNLANSRPSRLHLPCRISELGVVWLGPDTEGAWFGE